MSTKIQQPICYTLTTTNQTVRFDDGAELRFPSFTHVLKGWFVIYLECGLSFKEWEVHMVEALTGKDSFIDEIHPITRITMKDGVVIEIRTPADEDPSRLPPRFASSN